MKKYVILAIAGLTVASCNKPSLSEEGVRSFAISHIENQVGYADAVESFYAGASSELKVWTNPAWKNKPADFVFDDDNDGSNFYEDSINVTLHDVYLMGQHANVMGTIEY